MTTPIITNKVSLMGQVSAGFQFSHKRNGICYYMAEIEAERTSGYADHIPVIVSEKILKLPGKDSDICLKEACAERAGIRNERFGQGMQE